MNLGFITGWDWPSEESKRLGIKNKMFSEKKKKKEQNV